MRMMWRYLAAQFVLVALVSVRFVCQNSEFTGKDAILRHTGASSHARKVFPRQKMLAFLPFSSSRCQGFLERCSFASLSKCMHA